MLATRSPPSMFPIHRANLTRSAGYQRTDQFVHQRESRSAPAAVGRHDEVSGEPARDGAARLCQTRKKRFANSRRSTSANCPRRSASNLQILAGLQSQLQTEEDALNTAKQQRVYLETLVNQYRSLQGSPKSTTGHAQVGLPAIDEELEKLRAQLADLSSHYTDRHPDVRKLKQQIAETEKTRDQIIADLKAKDSAADPNTATANSDPTEMRDPSSPMVQLQGQLQSNRVEIANRERAVVGFKGKD